ncbi:beta-aspartyl-peptidase [Flavobacteriaceae bacterium UJ101]|nr:beta-aspartyl-peptidase [Flavobacteriaceae bacterium UJ101]
MKITFYTLISFLMLFSCNSISKKNDEEVSEKQMSREKNGPITIVIHGGAGGIKKENISEVLEKEYEIKLEEALKQGYAVLEKGGKSTEAVIKAIQVLEASPLFNAGVGAVFTHDGKNELDASIMDGKTGKAGAVAGVSHIKSPIEGAFIVMEKSPHVMMAGKGAELFAEKNGLEIVDSNYFFTEKRYNQLQNIKKKEQVQLDHDDKSQAQVYKDVYIEAPKMGTVGAVALDQYGNIAAGTSTGGMTNKRYGRIGDSPIIGAGTYADNATCGVSATGHGEFFIRNVVAYDIAALMKYKGLSLKEASNEVVHKKLVDKNGDGGIIALDRQGNIATPFNTTGMFRGWIQKGGKVHVRMFEEE